jgi:NADPH:quinone reductase-like Zn-dependent oxidoreductase
MQNNPQQMKAMAVDEFGGADKLTLHTLPVPAVDAGEVLIRVEVAGVGVWDAMEREGTLVFNEVRFPRVLGAECAAPSLPSARASSVFPSATAFTRKVL